MDGMGQLAARVPSWLWFLEQNSALAVFYLGLQAERKRTENWYDGIDGNRTRERDSSARVLPRLLCGRHGLPTCYACFAVSKGFLLMPSM